MMTKIFAGLLSILIWCACQKENQWLDAQITGIDARKCACFGVRCGCCNGYWLSVQDTSYLFENLPKGSGIDLENSKFPLPVTVRFYQPTDSCSKQWGYIIIENIKIKD